MPRDLGLRVRPRKGVGITTDGDEAMRELYCFCILHRIGIDTVHGEYNHHPPAPSRKSS